MNKIKLLIENKKLQEMNKFYKLELFFTRKILAKVLNQHLTLKKKINDLAEKCDKIV